MSHCSRPTIAFLIAGLLAACNNTPVKIDSISSADYSLGLVIYGARSGEMMAEIHGQPFKKPVSKQSIALAAPMPPWLPARHLTTEPGSNTPRHYRVVLTFNPAERGGVSNACSVDNPAVAPPQNGILRVSADYCALDRSVSHLVAQAPAASGTNDRRFRDLLAVVLASLLPANDPNMQSDSHCLNLGDC